MKNSLSAVDGQEQIRHAHVHARRRSRLSKRPSSAYGQLWRVVDGAVADALLQHPEYLTPAGRVACQRSITKRVTGAVFGYAEQSARGRSGARPAAVTAACVAHAHAPASACLGQGLRARWERLVRLLFGRTA
jgi:hypothetical protein